MSKDNKFKLNGTYKIEKSNDKAYKKITYSYEYKNTTLKYFVYLPVVAGKPDSYYIALAKKDVAEAYDKKKLQSYTKKYYNDVRHHGRKAGIAIAISAVVAFGLCVGGHYIYKSVNGWKEITEEQYSKIATEMNTHSLSLTLPDSASFEMPAIENVADLFDSNINTYLLSYDKNNAYFNTESTTYESEDETTKKYSRNVLGAIQVEEDENLYHVFNGINEIKGETVTKNKKDLTASKELKSYKTLAEASEAIMNYELASTTPKKMITQLLSGIQFIAQNGTFAGYYSELNSIKSDLKSDGKAENSIKYFSNNSAGSLKIVVSFDVDSDVVESPKKLQDNPKHIKGKGQFEVEINNYLLSSFKIGNDSTITYENEENEETTETFTLHKNCVATYNDNAIYESHCDWKEWPTSQDPELSTFGAIVTC